MKLTVDAKILEAGKRLATANVETESAISEVWLFPKRDKILLLEVDSKAFPSGKRADAFYFAADPEDNIPFPSGIAAIRPEEKETNSVKPPQGWGDWKKAIRIYPEEQRVSS